MFCKGLFTQEVRKLDTVKIRALNSPAPLAIDANANLMETAHIMLINRAVRLLVFRSGDVPGMVREVDLFFEMERTLRA
jgi:hypothetical protein